MTAAPMHDSGITPEQARALDVARGLALAGVPIFVARADRTANDGQHRLPMRWQWTVADPKAVDAWRPGDALCALMGVALDLADIDPRNGGDASWASIASAGLQPTAWAQASTPSGGRHLLIAPLRTGSRDGIRPGLDIKGGRAGLIERAGRGLAFIAPTVRISKVDGMLRPYAWTTEPIFLGDDLTPDAGMMADLAEDETGSELAEIVKAEFSSNVVHLRPRSLGPGEPDPMRTFDTPQAVEYVNTQLVKLANTLSGGRNSALFDSAILLGHFVPAFMDEAEATLLLQRAVAVTGLDDTPQQIATTIRGGLERGMSEPYLRVSDAPIGMLQTQPGQAPTTGPVPTADQLLDPTEPASGGAPAVGDEQAGPAASIAPQVMAIAPAPGQVDQRAAFVEWKAQEELLRRQAKRRADELEAQEDAAGQDFTDRFYDVTELDRLPVPEPLIDGVLNQHTYVVLRGRDGSYKSFTALDWALCLATGTPWLGRAVVPTRVMWLAGEGAYGTRKRILAWEQARGIRIPAGALTLRSGAVNFFRGGPAVDDFVHRVRTGGYGFVVLDTLRTISGGADGNASKDMGDVVDMIKLTREAAEDGTVLVVAHTDKADNDTRGASNIEDDADGVWYAKPDEDGGSLLTLKCTKVKDGASGLTLELRMRVIELDTLARADGRPETSLVIEPSASVTRVAAPESVNEAKVAAALAEASATGLTERSLAEVLGMPKSSVNRAVNVLAKAGQIRKRGVFWFPAAPVRESPASRTEAS